MPRPIGRPIESPRRAARRRAATVGNATSTISTPMNQPPRPSTSGYTDRSTALALRPKPPRLRTRRAISSSEEARSGARPIIAPAKPLRERGLRHVGREVDRRGVYSESSTSPVSRKAFSEPRARLGCSVQKLGRVAELASGRPGGRSGGTAAVPRRVHGGVAKSSVPPIRSVSTFDVRTRLYSVVARVRRPRVEHAPAGPDELRGRDRRGSSRCGARPTRSTASAAPTSARDAAAMSPQTKDSRGRRACASSDCEPEAARVAVRGREPGAERHRRGERGAADVDSIRPKNDAERDVALVDRAGTSQRSGMRRGGPRHRRGEVVSSASLQLGVLRAEVASSGGSARRSSFGS